MARNSEKAVSSRKIARTPVDVILGEAASGAPDERYTDMLAIASVIMNRARRLGVTPEDVVAAYRKGPRGINKEFDAYGDKLPQGVEEFRELAKRALREVQAIGRAESPKKDLRRINRATFYAKPADVGNLPPRLRKLGRTTGHDYFEDPENRAIGTALGYRNVKPTRDVDRIDFTPLYNSMNAPVLMRPETAESSSHTHGLMAPNYNAEWMRMPGLIPYPRSADQFAPPIGANRFLDRTQYLSSPARQSYAVDFDAGDLWSIPLGLLGDRFR